MYLKFFLSFCDSDDGTVVGSSNYWNIRQTASSHNNYKENSVPSFTRLKSSIASFMNHNIRKGNQFATREILINVNDGAMFQLEALCVPEYTYCTYNLETHKIGFGNNQYNAYRASGSDSVRGLVVRRGSISGGHFTSNEKDYFFNFNTEKLNQPEPFIFTCPENFHSQVLEELYQYIVFEKNFMFNEVTHIIEQEINLIYTFLKSVLNGTEQYTNYTGSSVQYAAVSTVFDMFMNDDKDIFSNSKDNSIGLQVMSDLCFQMMLLSNETF